MSKRIDWKKRLLKFSADLGETITNLMDKNAKLKAKNKALRSKLKKRTTAR